MKVQKQIETKIDQSLQPTHLEVINESRMHAVPPGSETHFKLVIVSSQFEGQGRLDRHRTVNQILAEELQNQIHALTLNLYTPQEWQTKSGHVPASPRCMGGTQEP